MSFRIFQYALLALMVVLSGCEKENAKSSSSAQILAQAEPAQSEANPEDTKAIKELTNSYEQAYNQQDADKMASFWGENAVLFVPITGETFTGRKEIAEHLKEMFENNKDAHVKIYIDSVKTKGPDLATEKAHFIMSHTKGPAIEGRFVAELTKENGKWFINKLLQFEKFPITSQFEKMKKLDWLAGSWIDQAEGLDITSVWKWDKHKNFLTEHFMMTVLGQNDFHGFQILGWDPVKEKLRSWVFDSDGGFGQGEVVEKDNKWFVYLAYTLPDGRTGSATNIYTKLDDNSYTFSSIGREIDGVILPDVGPFKIVRKE